MQAWDAYDVYLFDIDGTLLHCRDAVHYFAFCEALTRLSGKPANLDGVQVHGNTDVGILRDALALHNVAEHEWRPQLSETLSGMCRFVSEREAEINAEAIDGAKAACEHLRSRGAVLGVATGNLETIGWLKLKRAGLAHFFSFGAFSDTCEYRRDVFRAGVEEARVRTHAPARVCVVGDTPSDVRAAQENDVDVVAVATGIYSLEELCAENPTYAVRNLSELLMTKTSPAPSLLQP